MKKLTTLLCSAVALGLGVLTVNAEVPKAMWTGEMLQDGISINGYKLSLNGNTYNNGVITIGSQSGVTVSKASGDLGFKNTVVIRYANASTNNLVEGKIGVLASSKFTNFGNKIGGALNSDGKVVGIWTGDKWQSYITSTALTLEDQEYKNFVWVQNCAEKSGGKWIGAAFYDNGSSMNYSGTNQGLADSVNKPTAINIGGPDATTDKLCTVSGLTISGIAIYESALSAEEIANLDFDAVGEEFIAAQIETYSRFNYATRIVRWMGASNTDLAGNNGTFFDEINFKKYIGSGSYDFGNGNKTFWKMLCAHPTGTSDDYVAPGFVMVFDNAAAGKTLDATFGPLTLGGLWVKSGATGFKFEATNRNTRYNVLGDATGTENALWLIEENFTFNRNGWMVLVGKNTFEISEGKTLYLNSARDAGQQPLVKATFTQTATTPGGTDGGSLVFKGAGTITTGTLTATNGAELDYSQLSADRETAYINGVLAIDGTTLFRLPADLSKGTPYKLATSISGATDSSATFYVGENEYTDGRLTFDADNGTVVWMDTNAAVMDANSNSYESVDAALSANATQPLTILSETTYTLTLNGGAANTLAVIDPNDLLTVSFAEGVAHGKKTTEGITTYTVTSTDEAAAMISNPWDASANEYFVDIEEAVASVKSLGIGVKILKDTNENLRFANSISPNVDIYADDRILGGTIEIACSVNLYNGTYNGLVTVVAGGNLTLTGEYPDYTQDPPVLCNNTAKFSQDMSTYCVEGYVTVQKNGMYEIALNTFSITYWDDETQLYLDPDSYVRGETNVQLPTIPNTREGFTWAGWSTEKNGKYYTTEILAGNSGDKTFYSIWTGNVYQVSYEYKGLTAEQVATVINANAKNYTYTTDETKKLTLGEASLPDLATMSFVGWFRDAECQNPVTEVLYNVANDQTVYGKFTALAPEGDATQTSVDKGEGTITLPNGKSVDDVEIIDNGASFSVGDKTYTAKSHYKFEMTGDGLKQVIKPEEAQVGVVESNGDSISIGTGAPTVEGFDYSVEYSDNLQFGNSETTTPVPGDGTTKTFAAPKSTTASQQFYRLNVKEHKSAE